MPAKPCVCDFTNSSNSLCRRSTYISLHQKDNVLRGRYPSARRRLGGRFRGRGCTFTQFKRSQMLQSWVCDANLNKRADCPAKGLLLGCSLYIPLVHTPWLPRFPTHFIRYIREGYAKGVCTSTGSWKGLRIFCGQIFERWAFAGSPSPRRVEGGMGHGRPGLGQVGGAEETWRSQPSDSLTCWILKCLIRGSFHLKVGGVKVANYSLFSLSVFSV